MPNSQVHFLLVEDDDDQADLIQLALDENRIGNTVDRVADGEAAIAYVRQTPPFESAPRPDVILLDLRLPRRSGHEVLDILKADPDLCLIPVVILTTSSSEADKARAYAAHANSYLVKPIDFAKFHKMIIDLQLYWTIWNTPPGQNEGRRVA